MNEYIFLIMKVGGGSRTCIFSLVRVSLGYLGQLYCIVLIAFCGFRVTVKAAWSVTFDLLILEIKFLFFKNTVKILKFRSHVFIRKFTFPYSFSCTEHIYWENIT